MNDQGEHLRISFPLRFVGRLFNNEFYEFH